MEDNGPPTVEEAALIKLLRNLPVAVLITKRDDGTYIWQFLQGSGTTETFIEAMQEALTYLEAANFRS